MSKLKVVSLFSGGGGLDHGFVESGYEIVWAIDNEKNAVATYTANIGKHIICKDINEVSADELPACDVVIGGPPCQSFSLAGNRRIDDSRGRLVWKYLEIIEHLNPRAFIFENVTGILSAKNHEGEKVFPLLAKAFENLGYEINAEVVNALNYGVPQRRKRVIIVGLKNGKSFVFPKPTHGDSSEVGGNIVTVADALDDLPNAIDDINGFVPYSKPSTTEYQIEMRRGCNGVTEHFIPTMSDLDKYIISHVKPGGNYMDIPPDVSSARILRLQRDGGHTTCYGRLKHDMPSYTINTYFNRPNVGCNIHYKESRLITVREALRLQSFPDKYIIVSANKQSRNLIVGNAVPPKVAFVLAEALKAQIV
jgi:DNA-methyltransferase (dcm)